MTSLPTTIAIMDESDHQINFNNLKKSVTLLPTAIAIMDESDCQINFNSLKKIGDLALSRWERDRRFLEVVEVDITIRLIHDIYYRWERGRRFLEAVEVDRTIGLVHDSYRRWE
jgi:hypothetical protein